MSEHDWVTSDSPEMMLAMAAGALSERKGRLFACACGRSHWPRFARCDEMCEGIEVAERHADGLASSEELVRALGRITARANDTLPPIERLAREIRLSYECGIAACGP